MNVTYEQIRTFLKLLVQNKGPEADCDDCFARMAEFAEANLVGKPIPEALVCIDEHLKTCVHCHEDFVYLKVALGREAPSLQFA